MTQPLEDRQPEAPDSEEYVAAESARRTRNRRIFRAAVLVVAGVLLMWAVFLEAPGEIARWYRAAALESAVAARQGDDESGDYSTAIERVTRAIEWDPSNPNFFLQRSDWYLDTEQYEKALEDIETVIEFAPNHAAGYSQRIIVNRKLERFQEVAEDCDKIVELTEDRGFMEHQQALNGRAYLKAQGNLDLEEGLADSEQAVTMLRELEASPQKMAGLQIDPIRLDLLLSQTLDTRAYVRHLLVKQAFDAGDGETGALLFDQALSDYNEAIRRINRVREKLRLLSLKGELQVNQTALERLREEVVHCSVIHQHRGELYALRGWQRFADADFQRAKAMGYDPKYGW